MAKEVKGRFVLVEHEDGRFWIGKKVTEQDGRMIDQILAMTWPDPPTSVPIAPEPDAKIPKTPIPNRRPMPESTVFEWSKT